MYLENNQVKHYPLYVILAWTSVVVWMGLIFFFSQQPAQESSQVSRLVAESILGLVGRQGDSGLAASFENTLRTLAHGSIFFILAILVGIAFRIVQVVDMPNAVVTLIFCLLYAASDEWHQSVVPGRASEWADFLVDAGGSLLAVIILQVTWTWRRIRSELQVDR